MKYSIFNTDLQSVTLSELFTFITTCDSNEQIIRVNNDPSILRREVPNLPCFTPAGIFKNTRSNINLDEYSHMIALEFIVPHDITIESIFDNAIGDSHTMLCYRNISNDGIILLAKIKGGQEDYMVGYYVVSNYYESLLTLQSELSINPLTSISLINYDPIAYINEAADLFNMDNVEVSFILNSQKIELFTDNPLSQLKQYKILEYLFSDARIADSTILFQAHSKEAVAKAKLVGISIDSIHNYLATLSNDYNSVKRGSLISYFETLRESKANFTSLAEINLFQETIEYKKFPDEIYSNLPSFLQEALAPISDSNQKDVLLLSLITAIGGCLPRLTGIYDNKTQHSNLYSFILAPAASGKGVLNLINILMESENSAFSTIPQRMIAHAVDSTHSTTSTFYENRRKTLLIPANITHSRMIALLANNDGMGIIIDTEADTITASFKSEHGDYSSTLRKCFHNERITLSRVKDDTHIECNNPKLAICISGTPDQINGVVRSVENGLFSRFFIYQFESDNKWRDPSQNSEFDLDKHFKDLQPSLNRVLRNKVVKMRFGLTEPQWTTFNHYFDSKMNQLLSQGQANLDAVIKRHGLMAYKMLMILGYLRTPDYNYSGDANLTMIDPQQHCTCSDYDLDIVLKMVDVSITNALNIGLTLNGSPYDQLPSSYKSLLDSLTDVFIRQDANQAGKRNGLSEKSVGNFLLKYNNKLIIKIKQGVFQKIY